MHVHKTKIYTLISSKETFPLANFQHLPAVAIFGRSPCDWPITLPHHPTTTPTNCCKLVNYVFPNQASTTVLLSHSAYVVVAFPFALRLHRDYFHKRKIRATCKYKQLFLQKKMKISINQKVYLILFLFFSCWSDGYFVWGKAKIWLTSRNNNLQNRMKNKEKPLKPRKCHKNKV